MGLVWGLSSLARATFAFASLFEWSCADSSSWKALVELVTTRVDYPLKGERWGGLSDCRLSKVNLSSTFVHRSCKTIRTKARTFFGCNLRTSLKYEPSMNSELFTHSSLLLMSVENTTMMKLWHCDSCTPFAFRWFRDKWNLKLSKQNYWFYDDRVSPFVQKKSPRKAKSTTRTNF